MNHMFASALKQTGLFTKECYFQHQVADQEVRSVQNLSLSLSCSNKLAVLVASSE